MDEELGRGETSLDYLFKPPPYIGSIMAIGALVCGVGLVALRNVCPPRDWTTIIWCVAVGIVAGFAYRLVSAGVHGANIGGGLTLYVAPPLVATLVWYSYRRLVHLQAL